MWSNLSKRYCTKYSIICLNNYITIIIYNDRVSLELIKNEPLTSQDIDPARHQYLSVVIPDELKDYTYIQVKIVKSEKTAFNSNNEIII